MAESLLQQGPVLNSEETNFMADFTGEELKDLIIHPSDYASIMVENASALLLDRYPDFIYHYW